MTETITTYQPKFFKREEFACQCACGSNRIKEALIAKLDEARAIAGVPFKINSGFRCQLHNKAVGGAKTSRHLEGIAVDIHCSESIDRYKIINALFMTGFTGIGIAKTFIHADIRNTDRFVWVY
jgi:uncharacterized protein YcbK (DUF882 family)